MDFMVIVSLVTIRYYVNVLTHYWCMFVCIHYHHYLVRNLIDFIKPIKAVRNMVERKLTSAVAYLAIMNR